MMRQDIQVFITNRRTCPLTLHQSIHINKQGYIRLHLYWLTLCVNLEQSLNHIITFSSSHAIVYIFNTNEYSLIEAFFLHHCGSPVTVLGVIDICMFLVFQPVTQLGQHWNRMRCLWLKHLRLALLTGRIQIRRADSKLHQYPANPYRLLQWGPLRNW